MQEIEHPAPGGSGAVVRRLLADAPTSLGAKARARRWATVTSLFPELRDMAVLDLGGTVESWLRAPVRPRALTVVNLSEPGESDEPWITPVLGDACSAETTLGRAGVDGAFDLVFSNSLIEHVGGHAKRSELATQVLRLAPYHWVQTPYRYFPIEPHWLFPMMQFMPTTTRAGVATRWPLQHTKPATRDDALTEVLWTELLDITQMRHYFPGSRILREKIAGVTKSITAITSP